MRFSSYTSDAVSGRRTRTVISEPLSQRDVIPLRDITTFLSRCASFVWNSSESHCSYHLLMENWFKEDLMQFSADEQNQLKHESACLKTKFNNHSYFKNYFRLRVDPKIDLIHFAVINMDFLVWCFEVQCILLWLGSGTWWQVTAALD